MKFLALDYGLRRVGVARSNAGMAFPLKTLQRKTRQEFFAQLLSIIAEEAPDAIVIGLPVRLTGEEGDIAVQARNFAKSLQRRTSVPLYWMNEALSSQTAESDLRRTRKNTAQIKAVIDQQAAVRILESFLAQPEEKWMKI